MAIRTACPACVAKVAPMSPAVRVGSAVGVSEEPEKSNDTTSLAESAWTWLCGLLVAYAAPGASVVAPMTVARTMACRRFMGLPREGPIGARGARVGEPR